MPALIRSLATATPKRYVTGAEAYDVLTSHFKLAPAERELYRRLLLEGPIRGRHLAIDRDEQACEASPDEQLARFQKAGAALAAQAGRDAMKAAGLDPSGIGTLLVSTCTGYLCPGLSSYVAQELRLPEAIHCVDLVGMGCGSAIPTLRTAAGGLALDGQAHRKSVLAISVEVCSATLFMGNDPGLIVSNCLFGDGAAAAVVDGDGDGRARRPLARLVDFEAGLFTQHREQLRYRHEQGRLRNVLSPKVPVIGARSSAKVARRLLERHKLDLGDIDWFAVHPGGTTVLRAVQNELGLGDSALRFSHEVLQQYGNMSSPSVMFVLKRILEQGRPRPGQKGLLLSFGAGFSAMAALVEF